MTCQMLDITRTISRVGRGFPTGIDRVERNYIMEFLNRFPNAVYIAKLTQTYVVVDAEIMQQFVDADFGMGLKCSVGIKDAVRFKLPRAQRRARSFLRRNAKWQFHKDATKPALNDHLADGFEYTNVGHSNLDDNFMSGLKSAECLKIRIMIHDMIPLDFPQHCKAEVTHDFEKKMKAVSAYADQVICNSKYTKTRVQEYFKKWPGKVSYVVAYLGVDAGFTETSHSKSQPSCYVILGTIEPRKNHVFLLEVWEELSKMLNETEMPTLHIVGKRGWENDDFFSRLEASPLYGAKILEHQAMDDAKLTALLGSAKALLFPSIVEGYGLPAIEALAVGLPVVCSDIPVFKELLETKAHMLPINDCVPWAIKICEISKDEHICSTKDTEMRQNNEIPQWSAHFCHVFGK
jgi:glycosyltransferase involved in cell wall biosynthesis